MRVSKESTAHARRFHRSCGHVQVKMAEKENEDPSNEPPKKRKRVSLSLSKDRFSFKVDDVELQEAMKGYTAENTAKSNKWAINNYSQWYTERNTEATNSPLEILLTDNAKELCDILSAFVKETRKENGEEYTPKSLYLLIAGLQREIRSKKGRASAFNIFSDPQFEPFRNVCEHEFHRLHNKGLETKAKNSETFTIFEENKL